MREVADMDDEVVDVSVPPALVRRTVQEKHSPRKAAGIMYLASAVSADYSCGLKLIQLSGKRSAAVDVGSS